MRRIGTRHPRRGSGSLARRKITGAPRLDAAGPWVFDDVSGVLVQKRRTVVQNGRRVSARFEDGTRDRHPEWESGWKTGHSYG